MNGQPMNALVIDPERLDALRLPQTPDAVNLLATMLTAYADRSQSLIADIEKAIDGSGAVRLQQAAHALASNSAGVGAMRVAALCRELERAACNGSLDAARPLFDRLTLALNEANAVLAEIASTEAA